jgi:hypothetical protein
VIATDIPERVQLMYHNVLNRIPSEMGQRELATDEEVLWVTERLLLER